MPSRRTHSTSTHHTQEQESGHRADFGSHLVTPRDRLGLRFAGEQKYVRYDSLGQLFAPDYAPATDVLPLGLHRPHMRKQQSTKHEMQADSLESDEVQAKSQESKRGGYRGALPWPTNYRKRIHAVGSIVDRWVQKMGYAKTWRPASDQPKWVTLTQAGLRFVGLEYDEVDWPEDFELLNHTHHINMVRLLLAHRQNDKGNVPLHTWISERAIEADYPLLRAGMSLPTTPDGILEVTQDNGTIQLATGELLPVRRGDTIAVEVELSRKSFERYGKRVFPSHLEQFTVVWYFCGADAYDAVVAARRDQLRTDEERARIVIRQLEYA